MRIHRGCAGDAVTHVPFSRWDISASHLPGASGSTIPRFGSFLRRVDGFDSHMFGLAASEAATMDPQQRLLLQASLTSLRDADQGVQARDHQPIWYRLCKGQAFAQISCLTIFDGNYLPMIKSKFVEPLKVQHRAVCHDESVNGSCCSEQWIDIHLSTAASSLDLYMYMNVMQGTARCKP